MSIRKYLYRIEGKYHEDVTGEFIDRITDDLYVYFKDKGFAMLPESVKLVEKRVYYIQVDEPIDKFIDEKVKEASPEKYGVTIDKTVTDVSLITDKDKGKHGIAFH